MKLYHGTHESYAQDIEAKGLIPYTRQRNTFLSSDGLYFFDEGREVLKSKYYSQIHDVARLYHILSVLYKHNLSFRDFGFYNEFDDKIFFSFMERFMNSKYYRSKEKYYKDLKAFYKRKFPRLSIKGAERIFERILDKNLQLFIKDAQIRTNEIIKKAYTVFINECEELEDYRSFTATLASHSRGNYNYILLDWGSRYDLSNYERRDAVFLNFKKSSAECYGDIIYEIDSKMLDIDKLYVFNWGLGDLVIEIEQLGFIPSHYEMDFEDLKEDAKYYWKSAVPFRDFIKEYEVTKKFPFRSCELLYFDTIPVNSLKRIKYERRDK